MLKNLPVCRLVLKRWWEEGAGDEETLGTQVEGRPAQRVQPDAGTAWNWEWEGQRPYYCGCCEESAA